MEPFNWTCPHCQRNATITSERHSECLHTLNIKNADERCTFVSTFIVCPNIVCKKYTLTTKLYSSQPDHLLSRTRSEIFKETLKEWTLIPESAAKVFPNYIPTPILQDYREACLIRTLSPKASATLSRRCLQGMVRDFWQVTGKRTLKDEIDAIQSTVQSDIWQAIDAVRKLGNIGAHMDKDINVILDVDPDEAELLIDLIEMLLQEWYVRREDRKIKTQAVIAAAAAKKTPSQAAP